MHILQSLLKEKLPSEVYEERIFFAIPIFRRILAMGRDQALPVVFY